MSTSVGKRDRKVRDSSRITHVYIDMDTPDIYRLSQSCIRLCRLMLKTPSFVLERIPNPDHHVRLRFPYWREILNKKVIKYRKVYCYIRDPTCPLLSWYDTMISTYPDQEKAIQLLFKSHYMHKIICYASAYIEKPVTSKRDMDLTMELTLYSS